MSNLAEIIQLCKKRNAKAEKILFLRFAPKVLTICRRYVRDDQLAQDYLQDCFLQIFNKIEQFDITKGEFGAWLHQVATNVILQQLRKAKRHPTMVYMDELPEVDIELSDFQRIPSELLIAAIRQLPDGYRQVLNLYVFDGWKHQEIAQYLGISESASRSQFTRAKRLLKQILTQESMQNYGKRLA